MKSNLSLLVFAFAYVAVLAFRLWKCQFGIDLYDEPFFLLPAFKFASLGDKPFLDEIGGAIRHFEFFNRFLIASWFPFSVLKIRLLETVLTFGLLLWLVRVAFGTLWTWAGFLILTACFLLGGNFAFSHYMWLRDFLLLHHCLLLESLLCPGERFGENSQGDQETDFAAENDASTLLQIGKKLGAGVRREEKNIHLIHTNPR